MKGLVRLIKVPSELKKPSGERWRERRGKSGELRSGGRKGVGAGRIGGCSQRLEKRNLRFHI